MRMMGVVMDWIYTKTKKGNLARCNNHNNTSTITITDTSNHHHHLVPEQRADDRFGDRLDSKKKEKKKTGRCNIAKYSFNWFKITIIRRILLPILLLLLIIIITLYPSIAQLIDVVMDWIQ